MILHLIPSRSRQNANQTSPPHPHSINLHAAPQLLNANIAIKPPQLPPRILDILLGLDFAYIRLGSSCWLHVWYIGTFMFSRLERSYQ